MRKKNIRSCLSALLSCLLLLLPACRPVEKQITVVIRESGSGTREAFDRTVTNGKHFLEELSPLGKKINRNAPDAVVQTKNGTLLSAVAYDPYAIGYLSLASVNDLVRVVSVDGVYPSQASLEDRSYPLYRPFVIMTSTTQELSPITADFLAYLKSDAAAIHADAAGASFLASPTARANPSAAPIPVEEYRAKDTIPAGKVQIRGSTSLERLITSAVRSYAEIYGVDAASHFDIRLEGSSIGRKSVLNDRSGSVIGLSSAEVEEDGIESFRIALDAIAVILHRDNTAVQSHTVHNTSHSEL